MKIMEIKIVLLQIITKEFLNCVNIIARKMKHHVSVNELWIDIQHLDMVIDEEFYKTPIVATFDEKQNIIDFRDEDGTMVFYVQKF